MPDEEHYSGVKFQLALENGVSEGPVLFHHLNNKQSRIHEQNSQYAVFCIRQLRVLEYSGELVPDVLEVTSACQDMPLARGLGVGAIE